MWVWSNSNTLATHTHMEDSDPGGGGHWDAEPTSDPTPSVGRSWAVVRLVQCITGPRLKRAYFQSRSIEGRAYFPNKIETYADNVILAAYIFYSVACHVTPVYMIYYIARHGFPSFVGVLSTLKLLSFVPLSASLAYIVRGIGRYKNVAYLEFLSCLNSARRCSGRLGPQEASTTGIDRYDFQMSSHPITFRYSESNVKPRRLSSPRRKQIIESLMGFPMTLARYIAVTVVGRRMVYPGSLFVFNLLLDTGLSIGRAKLRRKYNAFRAKLLASDGNHIDCMFIDRRGSPDAVAKGNKLVICCEGNAAYYELGIVEIAASAGYSVLGWNHPGFAESTGAPFPDQEFNAVDVVVRYAITELGFTFQDIIIFAWSIGGYSASCAAMSYPDIGAVILDATFDELFPLVKTRVSPYLANFSHGMVQQWMNLNIAEQICRYPGPITIIRREQDEMMSEHNEIATNRANFLLVKILQTRYPNLTTAESLSTLWEWLKARDEQARLRIMSQTGVRDVVCGGWVHTYMFDNSADYPWLIGDRMTVLERKQLLLFLATQYMINVESVHCFPLPPQLLRIPSSRGNLVN